MRYLVTGVLVVVAASACKAAASDLKPGLIGLNSDEVRQLMGNPTHVDWWKSAFVKHLSAYLYVRTDGLGGVRAVQLSFDAKKRVNRVDTYYCPFSDTPLWLQHVLNAFGSPQK